MNILSWILFGLIVGIVAHSIDTSQNGKLTNSILLGIVGALAGGFLANLIFRVSITGFNTIAFLVAIVGSLILLSFGKSVRKI
jgi:uncharacterized membrane protein YeaQ/YmgE (transglycosylase-associated protein family)